MTFNPLAGGLPPALPWESLELFAAEVLPALRPEGRGPQSARARRNPATATATVPAVTSWNTRSSIVPPS